MRKIYCAAILSLLFPFISFAQTTYTWVAGSTGDYQLANNWTPARNILAVNDVLQFAANFNIDVLNIPNQTIGAIGIISGNSIVSFAGNTAVNVLTLAAVTPLIYTTAATIYTADALTIKLSNTGAFILNQGVFGIQAGTGGKIIINSNLILSGAKLDFDVAGTGGTTITGAITFITGTFNCANAAAISWTNNSNYFHAADGIIASSIPVSNWQTGSICTIQGFNAGTAILSGLTTNNFANFIWNCPAQINDMDLNCTKVSIAGTFGVIGTNGKYIRLAGDAGGIISAGAYNQTLGNIMLQSGAGNTVLTIAGNFSQTGGILDGVGGLSTNGSAYLSLQGAVTKNGIWQMSCTNSTAQITIDFSGTTAQLVNLSGTWSAPAAGRCNVNISNTNLISGVTLTSGTKLKIYSNAATSATCLLAGLLSAADVNASVIYNSNSTLQYAGSTPQNVTNTEFPLSNGPTNLVINNTLGINFPAAISSRTIAGTLYMVNGNTALGADTLFLTNPNLNNQINYTNGYITTGVLGKYFSTTGLPATANNSGRFPFGNGVNDRSLNLYFSSSNLSAGTAGMVYVSHNAISGVINIIPTFVDNGVALDKKTSTNWYIGTGNFTIGTGAETMNITVTGANIGSVDNYNTLRLTDAGSTQYGTTLMPNPSAGSNAVPVTGKSGLTMANINKALYIAADGTNIYNPLVNITFNWTGLGGNTDWTNAANWTGINAVGYPSASTENAVINSTSGTLPTINSTANISVYQLTVGAGMTLTLAPGSSLNVYDTVVYNGITAFNPSSTFGYTSSFNTQKIVGLQYGNLSLTGTATKILPSALTITGNYTPAGSLPVIGTGTIIYAGAADQRIAVANYYNLTITGNRSGGYIIFGIPPAKGIIDIANNFDVSGLSNYNHQVGFSPLSYTDINFSSAGVQTIPGIYYPGSINNSGNGARILDNAGSSDPGHIIYTRFFNPGSGIYTNTGSKVNFYVTGLSKVKYSYPLNLIFNDLEISGDNKGNSLDFFGNPFFVQGNFKVSLTNYFQLYNNTATVVYMGAADQTINAYKSNNATNTPAFKYPNIVIQGANRNVKLAGSNTDSIAVMGSLQVPRTYAYSAYYGYYGFNLWNVSFASGKGFIVDSSTINFIGSSTFIPKLLTVTGAINYNNLSVSGGTQLLDTTNTTIGGNLFISGNDVNAITGASPAVLKIGNGSTNRILNVLGNVSIGGTSVSSQKTGQIDLNPGTSGSAILNIYRNLSIAGQGQLMSTGALNGSIVFKGLLPHTYQNTGAYNNDSVNFNVGDGVQKGTRLNLQTDLNLIRSNTKPGTITIGNGDTLDFTTNHLKTNNTRLTGSAKFNLQAGATLITANTGGIEGAATNATNGSLINDATLEKNYDSSANYIFNATSNTNTNFPAYRSPFSLANVSFGDSVNTAIFSLNKSVDIRNSVRLQKFSTLSIGDGNYFNLKSTAINTAMVMPVPDNATIIYGTGRFVVERYFLSRRAWRLVTAPVTADAGRSIFNAWQLGGNAGYGSGTFISGPNANSNLNGLDITPQNNYSLKLGTNLTPVANTKTTLLSGTAGTAGVPDNTGMFLFVRGDRSTNNLFNLNYSTNTTLRDTGFIQIHQQTFTALSTVANGISLIGNPFAAPVDFTAITRNNIVNRFWVWDPYINNSVGGYVEFDDYANTGVYTLSTPSPGGLSGLLQSSQAIFVQTAANGPASLLFKESNKTTVINNSAFRPITSISSLRTNLFFMDEKDSSILADGNLVEFGPDFKTGVTVEDAPKLNNIFETLGLQRDNINLAIERRPAIVSNDTVFLKLAKTKMQVYQFKFEPLNMKATLEAFLEDNFTGLKTAINLQQTDSIGFSITDNIKSAAEDRFKIIFKNKQSPVFMVNYTVVKAVKEDKNIAVNWAVLNEAGIKTYEVEKQGFGNIFFKINKENIPSTGAASSVYSFLDKNAVSGINTYRIKAYDFERNFKLSKTVSVNMNDFKTGIYIVPNPAEGNKIGLAFNNMEAGVYAVKILNALGEVLLVKKINHTNEVLMETITIDGNLIPGIYEVEISGNKGQFIIKRMSYGR